MSPGREGRPSLKFYVDTKRGPGLQTECGHTQQRSPGTGGYRAESTADSGACLAFTQAFWVTGNSVLALGLSVSVNTMRGSEKFLPNPKVGSKLNNRGAWVA